MKIIIKFKVAIDNLTASISRATSDFMERVNWLYARIILIAIWVISQFFVSNENQEVPTMMWEFIPVVILFGILGLQFIIGIQAFNPMSAKTWSRPNWKHNPFNFKQPLQFFHFGGWFMLVGSIPYLPEIIEGNQERLFLAAMSASFGLSMLLGVRLSVLIYRRKFSHA